VPAAGAAGASALARRAFQNKGAPGPGVA